MRREDCLAPVDLAEVTELRALIRRTRRRSALLLTVVGLVTAPQVLLSTPNAGATSSHARVHVPNVMGMNKAHVYATMRVAGLYFSTKGPGSANGSWVRVVKEIPPAGTLVAWHSSVTFTTTQHVGHVPRHVPNVVGMDKAQVYAAMRRADLYFSTVGPGSSNETWIRVVKEIPSAGTVVAWHSSVTLTTSLHPKATVHAAVRVPNFVHMDRAQVNAALRKAGLRIRTQGPGSAGGNWSRVVHQSVRPGALVAWHSVVVLTTVLATPVHRPVATTTTTSVPASTTSTYPGETTTTTLPLTTTTLRVTTTTLKPKPVKKPVKKDPVRYRIGLATWYSYFPGRCATSYLPFGTRITVRNLSNGRTIHCVVTDRQSSIDGRVADLSETQFSELQPLWRGVVRVKVSW